MKPLRREDLYTLEAYARLRTQFRSRVMAHKRRRVVPVGPHVTLHFEDRLTIQYQIQEMLRIERIFEPEAIQEELDAYNPLIPDGSDWRATMMIEYPDPEERHRRLRELVGIEERVWVRVGEHSPIWAMADEDLERDTGEKTSAVHFLRFPLPQAVRRDALAGATVAMGIDHPAYRHQTGPLPEEQRQALVTDLEVEGEGPPQ